MDAGLACGRGAGSMAPARMSIRNVAGGRCPFNRRACKGSRQTLAGHEVSGPGGVTKHIESDKTRACG